MKGFDKALYEGTLVAFGRILSRYNAFAQGAIMKDVGRDLLRYLKHHGFEFEERSDLSDLGQIVELFLKNGFAGALEIKPADKGQDYVWHDLFLLDAYKELQDLTGNPFLSCPLNLCLYYLADKHGKRMKLHEKTFDMDSRVTVSKWEVVDAEPAGESAFDPLVIENVRLVEVAEERARQLESYAAVLRAEKEKAEIQSRLLETQSADLVRSREAALRAAQSKSDLLAGMSHEIRTLMNGVIGMAGLLQRTPLNEEQNDCVRTIVKSGDALLALLNDILDLSKIEAGRMHLEAVAFDLQGLVADTIDLLAPLIGEKKIELAGIVSPFLPLRLNGDPARLRQVLINLIGNALKFTNSGRVMVRAELAGGYGEETEVRFSVADTGIGISREDQARLFRPFVQAKDYTSRKYGGTGLGLAICKHLVELMGGRIWVQSNPGGGSIFSFTVKCLKAPQQPDPPGHGFRGQRALVVAECAGRREIVRELLGTCGMIASSISPPEISDTTCSAGFQRISFDLVIADAGPDPEQAIPLLRRVKTLPACADARIVLVSPSPLPDSGALEAAGTTTIRMPRHLPDLIRGLTRGSGPAAPADVLTLASALGPGPSGPKLLLVEDNLVGQRLALRLLENLGYRADLSSNGREALEALGRSDYDIVFLDCHMPEMDGFETVAELRKRESGTKHTTVIAMTASAMEGDRERCLTAGMDDYISKPIRSSDLESAIRKWHRASAPASGPRTGETVLRES
jgi:two-component system sensor histidine kinase/response regulator